MLDLILYSSSEIQMKSIACSTPPHTNYFQEADVVLHVGQSAQLCTLPAQLCHLLLQLVDLPLNLAA